MDKKYIKRSKIEAVFALLLSRYSEEEYGVDVSTIMRWIEDESVKNKIYDRIHSHNKIMRLDERLSFDYEIGSAVSEAWYYAYPGWGVIYMSDDTDTHSDIQACIARFGLWKGYDVLVAKNDLGRIIPYLENDEYLSSKIRDDLVSDDLLKIIMYIDVLWINKKTREIAAAFEVENTTRVEKALDRRCQTGEPTRWWVPAVPGQPVPDGHRTGCSR